MGIGKSGTRPILLPSTSLLSILIMMMILKVEYVDRG